jgi:hypothetical protein
MLTFETKGAKIQKSFEESDKKLILVPLYFYNLSFEKFENFS